METAFYTLQDFMTYTKGVIYIIMGLILVFMPMFWLFLTDKDEKKPTY